MKYITSSEKQTFAFAKKFTATLGGGGLVGLVGDLGAGKTAFTKGVAAGLGIKNTITSPTFVLMKVYKIKKTKSAIKEFVHIDAYRLRTFSDLMAIGFGDYLDNPEALVIVEWADRIKAALPKKTKYVYLKRLDENLRKIRIGGRAAIPKK